MSKHRALITNKALAWWGGGAVLLASTAVTGVLDAQSTAAPAPHSSTSGTSSSAAQGNGAGGGNNGNGSGNSPDGPRGAAPPPKALTVSHSVPVAVRLGRPGVLRVIVTNPNSQAVVLNGVAARITGVQTGPGSTPACTVADFEIAPSTVTERLGKGGSSEPIDLAVSMIESGENQDRCKGATYSFSFTVAASQA